MTTPTIRYAQPVRATGVSPVTYKAGQGYPIATTQYPALAPQAVSKPVTPARVITQSPMSAVASVSSMPQAVSVTPARVIKQSPITTSVPPTDEHPAFAPQAVSKPVTPAKVITQSPITAAASVPAPATITRQAPVTAPASSDQSPWGGGCPWQCDKTAFKSWCKAAIANPDGMERKELYGFLAECFLDADGDRDAKISPEEFDFLVEKAASLPRRFGLAPSWPEAYGDLAHRMQVRHQMFLDMNVDHSGMIGLSEWVNFALAHITEKVQTMDDVMDFQHMEKRGKDEMVNYCEVAVTNFHSEHYKSLYEHLFKTFVESDVEENGAICREQFDILIEDAAKAPRAVGLAPSTFDTYASEAQKVAARDQMFQAMDTDGVGLVTFENFLAWSLEHIAGKVAAHKAGQTP